MLIHFTMLLILLAGVFVIAILAWPVGAAVRTLVVTAVLLLADARTTVFRGRYDAKPWIVIPKSSVDMTAANAGLRAGFWTL